MIKKEYCPECDKKTEILTRNTSLEFNVRGSLIEIEGYANFCSECGQMLGDAQYNEFLQKAYDEYRKNNDLMSPAEIKDTREKYQLSQVLFANIVGIGEATLQRYERGSLQSIANNKLLSMAKTPQGMLDLLKSNRTRISDADYQAIRNRLTKEVSTLDNCVNCVIFRLRDSSFLEKGYSNFSFDKLKGAIARVLEKTTGSVSITKMNKLLFYVDFHAFERNACSITGLSYVNWQFGPVPEGKVSYELYNLLEEAQVISIKEIQKDDSIQRWFCLKDPTFSRYLNDNELAVIDDVITKIGDKPATELEELSHLEKGYIETSYGDVISYKYAESLKAME